MDLDNMSEEEIEKEIEIYKDRIETLADYISEIDDIRIIPTLNSQLQGYKSTLYLLENKKNKRLYDVDTGLDIDKFSFRASTSSLFNFDKLSGGPYGESTITINRIKSVDNLYELTIFNHDDNHSDYTNDLSMYPVKIKKAHIQFDNRIVFHTFQEESKSYGLGIVYKFGNVSEIIFDLLEDNKYIIYLP
ncbi:hypothetical protein [Runella slithyformis]|uniref:Uncharacterized protein n=1 Tax=Runella slithyformis (strain ATCC 29530 / DSM 19594 / LMG 11500 / NCIMB 11436 / LSU 4) TaxID=761193 RepID=A0A7U4E8Y8_RUNSL|nr:hypothetical protein [Runella slithyformis]AEI52121.1 hypothetical protein Runsl_5824 [Runella slithyformis DSM 19594]